MGNMVNSFDTYNLTELLLNIRILVFVGDALLALIATFLCIIIIKKYTKCKGSK